MIFWGNNMPMNFFLIAAIFAAFFIFGTRLLVWLRLSGMRRAGDYPQRGKAVMADVGRLLDNNKRIWAIRCYREIHACSLRQAKVAVEALSTRR